MYVRKTLKTNAAADCMQEQKLTPSGTVRWTFKFLRASQVSLVVTTSIGLLMMVTLRWLALKRVSKESVVRLSK